MNNSLRKYKGNWIHHFDLIRCIHFSLTPKEIEVMVTENNNKSVYNIVLRKQKKNNNNNNKINEIN